MNSSKADTIEKGSSATAAAAAAACPFCEDKARRELWYADIEKMGFKVVSDLPPVTSAAVAYQEGTKRLHRLIHAQNGLPPIPEDAAEMAKNKKH